MEPYNNCNMRVFVFILFIFTVCFSCTAQDKVYNPFVEEGKTWHMRYSNEEDYDYRYYMKGDTLIGGIECKKFYVFNYDNAQETEYLLAIFENDRKVYFIPKGMEDSYVLYDFDGSVGDIVSVADVTHIDWKRDMRIVEEKSMNIGLEFRRCALMRPILEENPIPTPSGWWIEGVGSELGPLNTWLFGADGNNRYLLKCVINEQDVFNMKDFKDLMTDIQSVNRKEKDRCPHIFTVSGVKGEGKYGIFIQDGKKFYRH